MKGEELAMCVWNTLRDAHTHSVFSVEGITGSHRTGERSKARHSFTEHERMPDYRRQIERYGRYVVLCACIETHPYSPAIIFDVPINLKAMSPIRCNGHSRGNVGRPW